MTGADDEGDAGPDPFDHDPVGGIPFDEDWVSQAAHREAPARTRHAWAEGERWQREQAARAATVLRSRRRRRRRNQSLVVLAVVAFAAAVALADRRGTSGTTWEGAGGDAPSLVLDERPTARPAASSLRLGTPEDPDASGGEHAFLATQDDGTTPVAYDPCRPISIVVNERTAPPDARSIVERAVREAAAVTGLDLRVTGSTDEPAALDRAAFQPDRYGDRWAPVLVAWTDESEVPELGGEVAGLGGSSSVTDDEAGHRTYVSGVILLDGPQIGAFFEDGSADEGAQTAEDIVLHELGHVVGLAHVGSDDELMHDEGRPGLHGYQQGDRTGLTRLGQGRCVALL